MAQAQEDSVIYILSDGSLYSTGSEADIVKEGNVYSINEDLVGFSFVVQCNNVVIDGNGHNLAGSSSETGIDVSYVNGVTIKNVNIVGGFMHGILLIESSDITVEDCSISGNIRGLNVYNSTRNTFTGNNIISNEIGLDIESSSGNMLRSNNFSNERNIVVFGDSLSNFAIDIDASNTVDEDKKVYYFNNKQNLVISPSTYPDLGILALINCQNITVQDLELTSNGQGIIVAYTTGSKVLRTTFTENHNAILLFSSSENEITGNIITENFRAIQISRSSKNNRINNNNITANDQGILLFDSSLNTFIGNNIENNAMGIGFSSASNNMIRGNYFVNNEQQVYDSGMTDTSVSNSTNYWNFEYPIGGNYWSDYVGLDVKSGEAQDEDGSDTIGDSPYVVYGKNQDNYPLLPYGSPFAVSIDSLQNKTYKTNSVSFGYTTSSTGATVSYSLDGKANVTITGSTTLSDLTEGPHKLTVYARDTDGTERSDTVHFTISEDGGEEPSTPTENEETEELPITLIAAAILIIAAVGVALLYFLKLKK